MPLESLKHLYDMQQACRLLAAFITGKTLGDYSADAMLRSAVERQLTIVGEALNRLKKIDPATVSAITNARQIIAFRNILVHGYDVVRDEVVWGILEAELPILSREVNALLEQGEAEQTGGAAS